MPIPLPISPADALSRVIHPALELLPSKMGGERADVMLVAIGLQESGLAARVQSGDGPARGLFQFELGGGVHGVMTHPASRDYAKRLLGARGCPATERSAWLALAGDDLMAAAFARLLLWTDSRPLPEPDDIGGAWTYYADNWRPGKPHPDRWLANHKLALHAVIAAEPA
jgi:hypothetical protein